MQAYRKDNPDVTKTHIAEVFDLSISVVTDYTDHILKGEEISIDAIRTKIKARQYTKQCSCGTMIRQRSATCLSCSRKKRPRYKLPAKRKGGTYQYFPYTLDNCDKAPENNPYHYYILDRFSAGCCKNCGQRVQFPVDGIETAQLDVFTSFETFIPSWAE